MYLTAESLIEIARELRGDAGLRRRRTPRVGMGHLLAVIPCDAEERPLPAGQFDAKIRDLSRRGIGLSVPSELVAGQKLLLALPHEGMRGKIHLLARVLRCEPSADARFHAGVEVLIDAPRALVDQYVRRGVKTKAA